MTAAPDPAPTVVTPPWQILTFGGLTLRRDDTPVSSEATQPRRLALLSMLAASGERGVSRERLLATLWPDTEEEKARRLLTQSIYVLRRDLGDEEAIVGTREVALDPELVTSDARRFARALKEGRDEDAVALYAGPFLEGFRLPSNGEFERWQEDVRLGYARQAADALERLAHQAAGEGRYRDALTWWHRIASFDPLDGRVALELMRASVAAGDVLGAVRHARIHEELVRQMLELPGDREVAAYAEELRSGLESGKVPGAAPPEPPREPLVRSEPRAPTEHEARPGLEPTEAPAQVDGEAPAVPPPETSSDAYASGVVAGHRPRPAWRPGRVAASVAAVAVVALLVRVALPGRSEPEAVGSLLAIGEISDYLDDEGSRAAAALSDMLATNLARVEGLRVLSAARMLEVAPTDLPRGGSLAAAARTAGATTVLEGGLHAAGSGGYRLDLRVVRVEDGEVLQAVALEGPDLFSLADSGTARVAARLGGRPPDGSIREVTTSSELAYTLYREGLRLHFGGDQPGAKAMLEAALREDPRFAMAAFWRFQLSVNDDFATSVAFLARADTLAEHAPERERWLIRARVAVAGMDPRLRAFADSMVERYPDDPDGWGMLAISLVGDGRYGEAIPALRRVLDGLGPDERPNPVICRTCAAYEILAAALAQMDSLEARVRVVEEWVRDYPGVPSAWRHLALARSALGEPEAAETARARAFELDSSFAADRSIRVVLAVDRGDLTSAAAAARSASSGTAPDWWLLSWVERARGRWDDAMDAARRERASGGAGPMPPGAANPAALSVATTLRMSGQASEAAALFDSLAAWRVEGTPRILVDRQRAWMLVQRGDALFEAGSSGDLAALADEIERLGAASRQVRDRLMHWHVRGLDLLARGDTVEALAAFERSVHAPSQGYTRTNQVQARVLLARGEPAAAIPLLQAALRGAIEGPTFFANPAESHRLLADAWSRMPGGDAADSARAHRDWHR